MNVLSEKIKHINLSTTNLESNKQLADSQIEKISRQAGLNGGSIVISSFK